MATYRVAAEIAGKGPYWAFSDIPDPFGWPSNSRLFWASQLNVVKTGIPSVVSHQLICVIVFGD